MFLTRWLAALIFIEIFFIEVALCLLLGLLLRLIPRLLVPPRKEIDLIAALLCPLLSAPLQYAILTSNLTGSNWDSSKQLLTDFGIPLFLFFVYRLVFHVVAQRRVARP
jgi:hypothetical protein